MEDAEPFWVHVQQPVVPHYRLPLFDELARRLQGRLRVSASLRCPDGPPSIKAERPWLDLGHSCWGSRRSRFYWQRGLSPLARGGTGDVVVFNGNPRYLSNFAFAGSARRHGMGLVWWGHAHSPTSSGLGTAVRRRLMGAMDAVLLYTDREAEEWRRLLPAHVNVTGAQNAVDQSDAQRLRADWSAAALTDFAQSQDLTGKRLLLFCGRLRQQPGTRLELAIRALPQLVAAHPEVVLVVIGDGERRHDLEQLAVQLGMTAHVRWLGPIYEEPQLAPWFLSAVCFVYPGSIGLSLLHAMGYGLPVITHDCERRHNPEIAALVPEVNGLVFHEDDAADLARQIRRVLGDDALRERLAAGALDTTTRVFTIDNMADRFLSAVRAARERSLRHAPAGRGP